MSVTGMDVLAVRRYKVGYKVETYGVDLDGKPIRTAYSLDGLYIGAVQTACFLTKKLGIRKMYSTDGYGVANYGWAPEEQAWYGWSHRGYCSFRVGSTVEKGDVAFRPAGLDDFISNSISFWYDPEYHASCTCTEITGTDVELTTVYNDRVPNEAFRHKTVTRRITIPKTWGRGEWTAATTDDARQMAIDFVIGMK